MLKRWAILEGRRSYFLHGGPGSGLDVEHRRFFDPEKFHVILFDQRGCGKSCPYAELADNTTADLVNDIEKIREHLKIASWHLFGGSWGSFLALAYGQSHPQRVLSLILRGLFLGRREELFFFYQKGASFIFPEAYSEYIAILTPEERVDILRSYYKRLHDKDPQVVQEAARHWAFWEGSCLKLVNTYDTIHAFARPERQLSLAKIESHYFYHNCFVKENQLLEEAGSLKNIPITLVHGRYDLICPIENAFLLKKRAPHMELLIAPTSGHAGSENEIRALLLQTLEKLK